MSAEKEGLQFKAEEKVEKFLIISRQLR